MSQCGDTFLERIKLSKFPGDFGRINSTSNNPRLIQLGIKVNF